MNDAVNAGLRNGFSLGDYDVLPQQGQVAGSAGSRHLTPKSIEVLLCLAERPGEVVDRAVLLREVWGEHGSDGALTHCIVELRHAFDDHPDNPRYIQTVPKHGYRLLRPAGALRGRAESPSPGAEALPWRPLRRLLFELRRRNVMRVAAVYAAVAWILVEVSATVMPALHLPDWAVTLEIVLLLLGFPIALVFAWIYQVTPQGVVVDTASGDGGALSWNRQMTVDLVLLAALLVTIVAVGYRMTVVPNRTGAAVDSSPPIPSPVTVAPIEANSVAVLPFNYIGTEGEDKVFSDGLSEELLNSLARLPELKVAARSASFYFQDRDVDLAAISERLRVRYVVEGSVRKDGERIRVTAQLVDTKSGFQRWNDAYDRALHEILDLQADIASAVVAGIAPVISPESRARLTQRPTSNVAAYEWYLRGRGYLQSPREQATLQEARRAFAEAVRLDPQFALAHAGLCNVFVAHYAVANDVELIGQAERSCQKALELDATLAEVRTALGNLYQQTGQSERAAGEFEQALSIDPKLAAAHEGFGQALESLNRLDEAEAAYRRAIELQPGDASGYFALGQFLYRRGHYAAAEQLLAHVTTLAPDSALGYSTLGAALMMQGRFEQAAREFSRSVELAPNFQAYSNTGAMYYYLGRFDEATAQLEKAVELAPNLHWVWGNLAAAYRFVPGRDEQAQATYRRAVELARGHLAVNPSDGDAYADLSLYLVNLGDLQQARAAIRQATALTPDSPVVHYYAALLHVSANEIEPAYAEIEKAIELGYAPALLAADPELAALRGEKRFEALLERVENERSAVNEPTGVQQ